METGGDSFVHHVIWDWNGTLIDDAPLACEILNEVLGRRNLGAVAFETYRSIYAHPVSRIYEAAGCDLQKYPIEVLSTEWHDAYYNRLPEIPLQEGAMRALDYFRRRGCAQLILSALPHSILLASVSRLGVEGYFKDIVGLNDNLARNKLDNGRKMMEKSGAGPEGTIMIGDCGLDVEVASRLGVRCFLVSRGYESPERLENYRCPLFESLDQVVDFMEKLKCFPV